MGLHCATGSSHSTVWRVQHGEQLHPFHLLKVQDLGPLDFNPRLQFCNWASELGASQPDFFSSVLFTDEAMFTREGVVLNSRNSHVWNHDNPYAITGGHHQN